MDEDGERSRAGGEAIGASERGVVAEIEVMEERRRALAARECYDPCIGAIDVVLLPWLEADRSVAQRWNRRGGAVR